MARDVNRPESQSNISSRRGVGLRDSLRGEAETWGMGKVGTCEVAEGWGMGRISTQEGKMKLAQHMCKKNPGSIPFQELLALGYRNESIQLWCPGCAQKRLWEEEIKPVMVLISEELKRAFQGITPLSLPMDSLVLVISHLDERFKEV